MQTSNKKILVPEEKLLEGFQKCSDLALSLLSDSKKLYESKKFVSSTALSILANEEVGKLNLIRFHITQHTGIEETEWREMSKLGSHSFKSVFPYQQAIDGAKKLGKDEYDRIVQEEKSRGSKIEYREYSDILKREERVKKFLKKLNEIKKACLYLDWKNSDWFSITDIYSEHEIELLANFLLEFSAYELFTEILSYRYPSNFFHQVPNEISVMKNDPLWKQREVYVNRLYTEEYQKFLDAVNFLIDKFPEQSK